MTKCACGNCQFFDDHSKAASKQKEKDTGLCRYNPPLAQSTANGHGLWPAVARKIGAATSQQRSSAS